MKRKLPYEAPEAEALGVQFEIRFMDDSNPQIKPGEEQDGGDY